MPILVPTAACDLTERHMGCRVDIGAVSGLLASVMPVADQVHIGLIVGGARTWFTLDPETHVNVGPRPREGHPQ